MDLLEKILGRQAGWFDFCSRSITAPAIFHAPV
jgi:hypothetical protein